MIDLVSTKSPTSLSRSGNGLTIVLVGSIWKTRYAFSTGGQEFLPETLLKVPSWTYCKFIEQAKYSCRVVTSKSGPTSIARVTHLYTLILFHLALFGYLCCADTSKSQLNTPLLDSLCKCQGTSPLCWFVLQTWRFSSLPVQANPAKRNRGISKISNSN